MTILHGRIDVHHHLFPPAYKAENAKRGITEEAGAKIPTWLPRKSLEVMDVNGIRTAILSLSAPGVHFGSKDEAISLARSCNTYAAGLKDRHRGRFGFFAVLPMPFTEAACREAIYALETLNADGIVLLGSTDGQFLGDPAFEELMCELDRRGAVVFVHPNLHTSSKALDLAAPGFVLEFLCDTSRAALNLIVRGVLERHPRIRWILAHAGGFLPYVAWRASLINALPDVSSQAPQGVLTYLRRFYFDTALSPSDISLAALLQLVSPFQILFGSDYPYAPAPLTAVQTKTLEKSRLLDATTLAGINRRHALALFPQYAEADESVALPPEYEHETLGHKLARWGNEPIAWLAERMRNQ